MWDFRVQGPTLIGRVPSAPLSPCSSQNDGELPSAEPLATPSQQVALGSERCPAFRIFQCRFLSKLIGANSHGKTFVVSVDPLGRTWFCHPEPLANNARPARVLPTLREWLLPLGKLQRDRFLDAPRGAIRENVCVTDANGSTMKDRSLPELIFHCEV